MPKKSDFDSKEPRDSRTSKDKDYLEVKKYSSEGEGGVEYKRIFEIQLDHRVNVLERQMKWLLGSSGVSLVVLIGAVFWLGGMKATVSSSTEKVDRVYNIVLENQDSLAVRTKIIETKLDSIDKKLDVSMPQLRPNAQR